MMKLKLLISHQYIDERYPLNVYYPNIELMFNDFNVQFFSFVFI